jgi:hypothetical protein
VRLDTGAMGYQTAVAFNETLKDLLPEPAAPAGVEDTGAIPREDPAAANAADDAWRATPVILLTASIPGTSAELREMFTNNDW